MVRVGRYERVHECACAYVPVAVQMYALPAGTLDTAKIIIIAEDLQITAKDALAPRTILCAHVCAVVKWVSILNF